MSWKLHLTFLSSKTSFISFNISIRNQYSPRISKYYLIPIFFYPLLLSHKWFNKIHQRLNNSLSYGNSLKTPWFRLHQKVITKIDYVNYLLSAISCSTEINGIISSVNLVSKLADIRIVVEIKKEYYLIIASFCKRGVRFLNNWIKFKDIELWKKKLLE